MPFLQGSQGNLSNLWGDPRESYEQSPGLLRVLRVGLFLHKRNVYEEHQSWAESVPWAGRVPLRYVGGDTTGRVFQQQFELKWASNSTGKMHVQALCNLWKVMAPPSLCCQRGDIAEGFVKMAFSFYSKRRKNCEILRDVGCPPRCKVLSIKIEVLARNKCSTLSWNLSLCKKYIGIFFCVWWDYQKYLFCLNSMDLNKQTSLCN